MPFKPDDSITAIGTDAVADSGLNDTVKEFAALELGMISDTGAFAAVENLIDLAANSLFQFEDKLIGGLAVDTFVFASGFGNDATTGIDGAAHERADHLDMAAWGSATDAAADGVSFAVFHDLVDNPGDASAMTSNSLDVASAIIITGSDGILE